MNMDNLLFKNTLVIDPHSSMYLQSSDVRIRGGKIQAMGRGGSMAAEPGEQVLEGGCLSPGWVDMRVHMTVPGHEEKEDLQSLAEAGAAGGFTRLLGFPNTTPALDNAGQIRSLILQARGLPCKIMPAGSLSVGSKGNDLAELYDMSEAGAVAFTDGLNSIQSAGLLLRALQYTRPFGALVIDYPFDNSLAGGAEVAEGVHATMVGMKGIPALAEEMGSIRALKIFEHDPHRLHLGPVTCQSSVEMISGMKAALTGLSVETSVLYLLLDDSSLLEFDGNAKLWPPLRTQKDVLALREALRMGLIDVLSSSHHPQSVEEKTHDFADAAFGAETLETAYAAARTALDKPEDVETLVHAMAIRPRAILNLPASTIETGADAELTWFDSEKEWVPSLADIRSKSKNNPLIGRKLKGKPLGTVLEGRFFKV